VKVSGIAPGGEPGHDIEFFEEAADDFVGVVFGAELFELAEDPRQRGFDIGNRAFGKIRAVLLQTASVLVEFFSVKLGDRVLRADRPRIGHEAWHARSSSELSRDDPV
jgi:hypothetical protein